jgi:hypothetical protein
MARLRVLPVAPLGSSSTTTTVRGYLYADALAGLLAEVVGGEVTAVAQDDDGGDLLGGSLPAIWAHDCASVRDGTTARHRGCLVLQLRGREKPERGVPPAAVVMADRLGVSRTPLREALPILQNEGLVPRRDVVAVAVAVEVAALVLVPLAGCGGSGGDRLSGELPSAAAAPNQSGPASRNAHGK